MAMGHKFVCPQSYKLIPPIQSTFGICSLSCSFFYSSTSLCSSSSQISWLYTFAPLLLSLVWITLPPSPLSNVSVFIRDPWNRVHTGHLPQSPLNWREINRKVNGNFPKFVPHKFLGMGGKCDGIREQAQCGSCACACAPAWACAWAVRSSASLTPIFNPVYPPAHCQIARCLDLRPETLSLIFFHPFW